MITTESFLAIPLSVVEKKLRDSGIIDKLWVVKLPKSGKLAVYCTEANKNYYVKFKLTDKDVDIAPTTFDELANISNDADLETKISKRIDYYISVLIDTYTKINNIYKSGFKGSKPNKSYIDIGELSANIMKRTKSSATYLIRREDEILEGVIDWTYFNIPNRYQNFNPSYLFEEK